MLVTWEGVRNLSSRSYVCGYCDNPLASEKGFTATCTFSTLRGDSVQNYGVIYICHHCNNPTFFDTDSNQFPGTSFGKSVDYIPSKEVTLLYNEARDCMKVNAYTASVMCCRKLLMNIAVDRGANLGLKYVQYVDYLADKGFVPPNGKGWVEHIKNKGNEANHEIVTMTRDDAEELNSFVEMLLKFIYEFPGKMNAKTKK